MFIHLYQCVYILPFLNHGLYLKDLSKIRIVCATILVCTETIVQLCNVLPRTSKLPLVLQVYVPCRKFLTMDRYVIKTVTEKPVW